MTPEEFDRARASEGWSEPKTVQFKPQFRSPPHTHDLATFVYVLEGTFILNTADGAASYQAGETCVLPKDIEHAEEAGPKGATIVVARK